MLDLLRDAKNIALLRLLREDPRMAVSELARRVAMSAPAVRERLQRLQEAGVVSWRVDIDPRALGFPVCAYVRVRPAPGQLSKVAALAQNMPQVTECHRVTGEDCYIARLHLRSMDDLEGILDRFAAVGQTTTSIVHSAPVAHRPLPLPDASDGG